MQSDFTEFKSKQTTKKDISIEMSFNSYPEN